MNKSFTLIEILVVIVIIGILSAFIIVGMAGVSDKARIAKSQAFSNSLKNSLMLNLVSEWKLNQVNNPSVDQTPDTWGGGNNGTLKEAGYGGVCDATHCPQLITSDCVSGGCLSFDGTNDYVDLGSGTNLNINDAITIEAWIKYAGGTRAIVFSDSDGSDVPIEFYVSTGTLMFYSYYGGNANSYGSGGTVPADKWSHVVATFDKTLASQNGKVYINSAVAGTQSITTPLPPSNPLKIGSYGGSGWFFSGPIDDVRIYNAAISTSQIQENYYSGLNRLLANNSVAVEEYSQRLAELKSNLANND